MPPLPRPDADLVRDVHPVRRIMPFVMPSRTESAVLCREQVLAGPAIEFLAALNARRPPDRPASIFHMVLRSLARTLHERPRVNRFVAGGRYWQRRGVWISFSGKRGMSDDAPIYTAKRLFSDEETFEEMVDSIWDTQMEGRSGKESSTDKEISLLLKMPPFVLSRFVRFGRWLNERNLFPKAMIDNDPLFASAFVANLGSVGIDACYHHNYDYGTIPVFLTIGRLKRIPIVDETDKVVAGDVFDLKYTYDERTEDGFYVARGLDRIRERLEHPEML
jgi:pyruvate/2-oxoglutarate dehydrogenase complex dihydrolipoamide acyltransferase (E2) component